MTFIKKLARDEQGATAIEYGLIAALVAVGLIVSLTAFGTALSGVFNKGGAELGEAVTKSGA